MIDILVRILRIDSSAQAETAQYRRLTDRIIDGLHALINSPDVTVCDLDERHRTGLKVAKWRIFCYQPILGQHPAQLKSVSSDNAQVECLLLNKFRLM
jgi:hypothetical protein